MRIVAAADAKSVGTITRLPKADADGRIRVDVGGDRQTLDFASWLPFAADTFKISKNVDDYVVVPVLAILSDLPNRRGVAFPFKELRAWNRQRGCVAYQTWKGQPVHIEHASDDPASAVGIVVDTSLRRLRGFADDRLWKMFLLLAIDTTKPHPYVGKVLRGEINSYSMGAFVEHYSCGYCGAAAGSCHHIDLRRQKDLYTLNGKMVYRNVHGISGYEISIVSDPAYIMAHSDNLQPFKD